MLAATLRYWLVLFLVNDNFMADVVSMDLVCNWSLCLVCVGFFFFAETGCQVRGEVLVILVHCESVGICSASFVFLKIFLKCKQCLMSSTWVMEPRAMDFLVELFRNLNAHQDWSMSQCASAAYTSTLKKYHGWIASAAFSVRRGF
jgi:hypothetical protein